MFVVYAKRQTLLVIDLVAQAMRYRSYYLQAIFLFFQMNKLNT